MDQTAKLVFPPFERRIDCSGRALTGDGIQNYSCFLSFILIEIMGTLGFV